MSRTALTHRTGWRLVVAVLVLATTCATTRAQTEPGLETAKARQKARTASKTGTRPKSAAGAGVEPADKATESSPDGAPPRGIFGDPKKFTRLGGWGSFGNAMGQFGFAKATLIMMPPVQEELKLTPAQKENLRRWQESLRKSGEEMGRAMREQGGDPPRGADNVPLAARVMQFTNMINQVSGLLGENEAGLNRILDATQRKRLSQIAFQMEGVSALTRPEVAEAINLSPDDQELIQQILSRARMMQMTAWVGTMASMRPNRPNRTGDTAGANDAGRTADVPGPAPGPNAGARPRPDAGAAKDAADAKAGAEREKAMRKRFEAMRDQTDEIQTRAVREISRVLTRGQKAKFEKLLGPPFDPSKVNNFGRPPRRPGPSEKPSGGQGPASSQ